MPTSYFRSEAKLRESGNISGVWEQELKCAIVISEIERVMEVMETTVEIKEFSRSPESPLVFMFIYLYESTIFDADM